MTNRLMAQAPTFQRDYSQEAANMNGQAFTRAQGWYWFANDKGLQHIDMPVGTKGWLRENPKPAKAYLRKVMGDGWQVDDAYQLAIEYATQPKAWSNRSAPKPQERQHLTWYDE